MAKERYRVIKEAYTNENARWYIFDEKRMVVVYLPGGEFKHDDRQYLQDFCDYMNRENSRHHHVYQR